MKQKVDLSFVDISVMDKTCTTAYKFDKLIDSLERNPIEQNGTYRKVLCNYDFSEVDFENVNKKDFTGWIIDNVIFSSPSIETDKRRVMSGFSFMGAKMNRVVFSQAKLIRCNFDTPDINAIERYLKNADCTWNSEKKEKMSSFVNYCKSLTIDKDKDAADENIRTQMSEIDFFFSELVNCRFRDAQMEAVDFRYSSLENCTLRECDVKYGDFYSTIFRGTTTFQKSQFRKCSLTNAIFEGYCIRMSNLTDGILQSSPIDYNKMVTYYPKWYRYNPCMNFSDMLHDKSPEKIYSEAFEVYKQLSGIYAGKGLYQDSNKAYEKFKDFEGEYYKERLKRHWKEGAFKESLKDVLALMGIISIWALGYGFKWKAVVIWLMIIVSFWTFIYYISINQRNLLESIHYSLNNSLGANDHFYSVVQGLLPSIESFFGVLLVGFLGFVFANKVRNNA